MQLNKSKTKTRICKICFNDVEESLHSILFKDVSICHKCFDRFNPVVKSFKVDDVKAFYLFNYDATIRELLYQFKGCADIELSQAFLEYFHYSLRLKYRGYTIVPAPSSKESDEQRGFNHVVEIFSCLKLPTLKCVHKTKDIKQADLTADERKEVHKILKIDDIDLSNKKILIVDDVYTTGSTVRSMISLVKSKHPKKIKVLLMSKTMELKDQNRPNS